MQLQIDEEQKEIKMHGSYEFPLRISHEKLSWFDTYSFQWHWHPEIELTYVLEGAIAYQVNETLHCLQAGEGLFCNTNALHAGHRLNTPDCHYLSITFHPRLLYGYSSSIIQSKYVNPILNDKSLTSILFTTDRPWMAQVLEEMARILEVYTQQPDSMEMQLQTSLLKIWTGMYENVEHQATSLGKGRDTERIRLLIEYIQRNYRDNLTLDMLADQVHLCKSEACRMFKRYMNETMFDYLLRYRIECSLELLKNSGLNVTQVAEQAGFATPGYYTRVFRQHMGCTPMQYRKKNSQYTQ